MAVRSNVNSTPREPRISRGFVASISRGDKAPYAADRRFGAEHTIGLESWRLRAHASRIPWAYQQAGKSSPLSRKRRILL